MSLFQGLSRITDMMGTAALRWEGGVGLEADVAQLRRGDLDALSTLVSRYQNRLYRFLLRLVRDRSEAEDLFQQTWIHVAEKIRRFDPSRNFDAWLFTVARNLAIDHLRRIRPASLDQPISEDESQETALDRLVAHEPGAARSHSRKRAREPRGNGARRIAVRLQGSDDAAIRRGNEDRGDRTGARHSAFHREIQAAPFARRRCATAWRRAMPGRIGDERIEGSYQ